MLNYPFFDDLIMLRNDMLNYQSYSLMSDLIMLRNDMLNYQSYSLMSDLIMLRNVGRYQGDNQKP